MTAMLFVLALLYSGHPLTDALRDLENKGLRLIYSEDVVTPEMMVKEEPRSTEPRKILDELLAPHRLRAVPGPSDTLLIVRLDASEPRSVMPVTLGEIVVTPSRYEILAHEPESRQFLSRDEVRRVPHLSDDLFRAIAHVPGTTSSEVTARPNIRGGTEDEVAVFVDGAEIYDPFHLKDLFRAFSTIDAEAVGAVDILTGGFPSEYGGRMSGVIDVDTLSPASRRTEIGISLLNTRLLSQGTFRNGRGEWLLSLRRGYLREVLQLVDDTNELDPRYLDVLGKVQWTIGNSAVVSAHVLAASDRLRVDEDFETATARYDDRYFWLNIRGAPVAGLFVQSVASIGQLATKRSGFYGNAFTNETGRAEDDRRAQIIALKNDAAFDVSPRSVVKGGLTVRGARASYRYAGEGVIRFSPSLPGGPPPDITRSADVDVSGTEISAYVAQRMRLSRRVVGELGLRFDSESFTPDGAHVSPRLNVGWAITPRTSLRAAWGLFAQSQHAYELPVEDGVLDFSEAQRAEHRVIGMEQSFRGGVTARLELYDKQFRNLRPRYDNIFNRVVLFPELRYDRLRIAPDRARARGVELLLRTDPGKALSGWFNLVQSDVTDFIHGRAVARGWDQRDALAMSINYRRGQAWNLNLAGNYHSGWPTTPITARIEDGRLVAAAGALNSARLPAYRRFDFRASRNVAAGSGVVGFFVELFNAFNNSNVVRVNGFDFDGVETRPRYETLFGILPSFGVTWQF